MMEGPPGADSEEKHEPASDVDTVAVDSLKALDPEWPIREALDPEWPIREADIARGPRSANSRPEQVQQMTWRRSLLLRQFCQMPRRRGGIIRPPLTRAYSRGRRFCAERCRCD